MRAKLIWERNFVRRRKPEGTIHSGRRLDSDRPSPVLTSASSHSQKTFSLWRRTAKREPLCARGSRAFLQGMPTGAEGGPPPSRWRKSRSWKTEAGTSWPTTMKKSGDEEEESRERDRDEGRDAFACFWVSLYILLPTYTCRRVSRRCSKLNILVVQPSLAFPPASSRISSLRTFFVFFLRIIATMACKQTRNPLVINTRHPSRIQNVPPFSRRRNYGWIPWQTI